MFKFISTILLCCLLSVSVYANAEDALPKDDIKVTENTFINLSYSTTIGGKLELFRLRWTHFQMSIAQIHIFYHLITEARGGGGGVGLLGVGYKNNFGDDNSSEAGFLIYPMAFGAWSGFKSESVSGEGYYYLGEFAIYYRYNYDSGWNFETGLLYPIIAFWEDIPIPMIYIGFGYYSLQEMISRKK